MVHQPVSRRRRHLLKTAGAAAALGSLGFPAIVRSQAETVRIGHLRGSASSQVAHSVASGRYTADANFT